MPYPIRIVDVFTERPFAGNQLAVVLSADGISSETMQSVATEMNFAETTFVLHADDRDHAARIRIFTPATELPFAGHPTVGTAWVLWTEGHVSAGAKAFTLEENVGPVNVRLQRNGDRELVWMTHPSVRFDETIDDRSAVASALDLTEKDLLATAPIQVASTGNPFLFVPLRDRRAVDAAASDKARLAALFKGREPRAVFIFAVDNPRKLYSRMFAPHLLGIHEDAATGSAAGPLGAYAVKYGLVPRAGTVSIVNEQGTKMGRPSFLHIELAYEKAGDIPTRIEVGGSVVPVVSGELTLPTATE
ncbi:MAG: PhzF family phenazine biosynthesis protein [Candidatus Dormibacteraeota bacterium]|nr:PhzF family phenazine biosynthesis protein [Candidatus Dormibacteraeota bacterium]